jgi:hypothetical protein
MEAESQRQPFKNPFVRGAISFTFAIIAAKITWIPFISLVYFEKSLPEWGKVAVLALGLLMALFAGIKCFRSLYRFLGDMK